MEPLTTAAIAIGTIVATQALETTTEKVTEAVFEKGKGFLSFLRQESPETVTAIEKAPQQPLNYGDVVLAVERAAQASPQVRETMEALVMTAQSSEIPNLENILQDIATALKNVQAVDNKQIFNNTIEKLVNLAQGQGASININEQNITI
jgi:hypothetical protein